jgi:ESF2/ABP1 family protein
MSDDDDDNHSKGGEMAADTTLLRVRRKKQGVAKELDPDKLKEFADADRRKGVIYVSRIPPFMKPVKLRHLLEKFAKLGRVYLAPEGKFAL